MRLSLNGSLYLHWTNPKGVSDVLYVKKGELRALDQLQGFLSNGGSVTATSEVVGERRTVYGLGSGSSLKIVSPPIITFPFRQTEGRQIKSGGLGAFGTGELPPSDVVELLERLFPVSYTHLTLPTTPYV